MSSSEARCLSHSVTDESDALASAIDIASEVDPASDVAASSVDAGG